MLLRRDALDRAGGLQSIRGALIDDCTLGALMKHQGAIRLALGTGLFSLRPYPALADIRAMVARSAYAQLRYSRVMLAVCICGLALTYLAPPLLTLLAQGLARWMGAAAWVLMTLSYVPILRFYKLAWWRAEVAQLAVAGASQLLKREVDAAAHAALLDDLAERIAAR